MTWMKTYNVFLEGIPGSGKSTLLDSLSTRLPTYRAYREGDISPVELAWCSYMTLEQYDEALSEFPELASEIANHSAAERDHRIVAYTRIPTKNANFYKYMERFEIYSGRRSEAAYRAIVYERNARFRGTGNLFECSFFQNTMDELILYKAYDDARIVAFYQGLIERMDMNAFQLIRLVTKDVEKSILRIKAERVNEKGEEVWYRAMTEYIANAPYANNYRSIGLSEVIGYFLRRLDAEAKVLVAVLPKGRYIELQSKAYDLDGVLNRLNGTE